MRKALGWVVDVAAGVALAVMLEKPIRGTIEKIKSKASRLYSRVRPKSLEQWVKDGYK